MFTLNRKKYFSTYSVYLASKGDPGTVFTHTYIGILYMHNILIYLKVINAHTHKCTQAHFLMFKENKWILWNSKENTHYVNMLIALKDISTQHPEHRILGTKVNTSYNFRVLYIWNSCKHILGMRKKPNINKMTILHQIYCSSSSLSSESFSAFWLNDLRILTQHSHRTSSTASELPEYGETSSYFFTWIIIVKIICQQRASKSVFTKW